MTGILESMSSMVSPQLIGQLGRGLGVDPQLIDKGMAIAGPLVTGTLANKTSTPDGARSFADLLTNADALTAQNTAAGSGDQVAQMLGSLMGGEMPSGAGGMLDGLMGLMGASGGTGADMMQGVLGQGINAIGGTLSQKLGFDVKPLLTMAVPMVMGLINKQRRAGNLDADGLASLLQGEAKTYADNPANRENLALINQALAAGDEAAALRGKFSEGDWTRIRMAPIAATYLVAKASPSRGGKAAAELSAARAAVDDSLMGVSPTSFLNTAFGGGLTGAELDVLERETPPDSSLLMTITDAKAAVARVSGSADASAYSDMIMRVANGVANAAKEGGFLGIGGAQVSKEEAAALNAIKAALS